MARKRPLEAGNPELRAGAFCLFLVPLLVCASLQEGPCIDQEGTVEPPKRALSEEETPQKGIEVSAREVVRRRLARGMAAEIGWRLLQGSGAREGWMVVWKALERTWSGEEESRAIEWSPLEVSGIGGSPA